MAALAATAALAPMRAARAQGPAKTRLVLLGTGGGLRVIPNGRAKLIVPCWRRRGLEGLVGGKGADQVPHHAVRRRRV
jgi:hypothetical protein